MEVKSHKDSQQEQEEANTRLKEKISRLEVGPLSIEHTLKAGNILKHNWASLLFS